MIVNKKSKYGNELDTEFKEILLDIKPHITSINSAYHLNQYKLWLEVLSNPHVTNKEKRNIFLRELATQIKRQIILSPFTEVPDIYFFSDLEAFYFNEEEYLCVPDFKLTKNMDLDPEKNEKYKSLPRNIFSTRSQHENTEKTEFKKHKKRRHASCTSKPKNKVEKVDKKNSMSKIEYVTGNPEYIKLLESAKNVNFIDSNSWLDLSCSNSTKSSIDNPKESPKFGEEDNNTDFMVHECCHFTPKLEELDRISLKSSFKETNVIVTDLKKTIEGLQLRLSETIKQNNDLKNEIKNIETKDLKPKSSQGDIFADKLNLVENNFVKNLEDLQKTYEAKIEIIQVDNEIVIKEKNDEIAELKNEIIAENARINKETEALRKQFAKSVYKCCNKKVNFLQKCVRKMDNLFHKSEAVYVGQLKKLRRELEHKEKSMMMFLKSQRVGVVTQATVETQEQINIMVNNLEDKYAKMFEIQSITYSEKINKQERYIEYLKNTLKTHSVTYNDYSE